MPVESPLPENHPLMIAWKEYQKSESFDDVQRWICFPKHTHGSQWALFRDGYNAAELQIQSLTTLCAELVEALTLTDRLLDDIDTFSDMYKPPVNGYVQAVTNKCIETNRSWRIALTHATELLKKKE